MSDDSLFALFSVGRGGYDSDVADPPPPSSDIGLRILRVQKIGRTVVFGRTGATQPWWIAGISL
jgi:hypothetical protein